MIENDLIDPNKVMTEKEYFQMRFDCLPDADKVAIIAFMCGTTLDGPEVVRDIDHDIHSMLNAGIRDINLVESFARDILNSSSFEQTYFDQWVDMNLYSLDFDGNMFWHLLSEMNEDMHTVVRFCYPFDDKWKLVEDDEIPFIEAFCR